MCIDCQPSEMNPSVEQAVANKLLAATRAVEAQVEEEIERLNNLGSDDLDKIREERLAAMKAKAKQVQELKAIVRLHNRLHKQKCSKGGGKT